ncbi:hydantoinase/oxoprolinase family protein [Chloroflexota bacterium]
MKYNVSIDVGGTFTDCILLDSKGQHKVVKVPTTPDDTLRGIMDSLKMAARQENGITLENLLEQCDTLTVGSTVATNAVLQNKGARCCMITTKGFRDILEMRTIVKKDLFNFRLPKPRILIPRYLRFVVEERASATGEMLTPLNEAEAREAARKAKAHDCQVVVICFMHSYINGDNEKRMEEIVREEYPEAEVMLSSNILPRPREFDRFSTTALAGYISPVCSAFLNSLDKRLENAKYKGTLLITASDASVTTVEQAMEQPGQLLSSGPAAGVLAGSFLGNLAGLDNIVIGDMGGTSFDVSVMPHGRILTTNDSMVGDQKNAANIVDVRSIGAGGGSIASLDQRGIICVGPESASADPGPVCYRRGGKRPTVTDADVTLGYIPGDYFLGGELELDASMAEAALKKEIAEPLGIDVHEAAYSIYSIVNANMANQIFLTCVSLGYDPRDYVFCAGGGAGPAHAFDVAARLGLKKVYIPKTASVFCAFGMMASADFRHEFARALLRTERELGLEEANRHYQAMEAKGLALLGRIKGLGDGAIKVRRGADIRYFAQAFDIEAAMPETGPGKAVTQADMKALFENFHERHEEIYGHADRDIMASTTSLRVVVRGERPRVNIAQQAAGPADPSAAEKRSRSVYFKDLGGFVTTPCYDGYKLQNGNIITGPAVIEERTTTVLVPSSATITVDRYGNYAGTIQ